jgi:hypothetical protein
MSVDALSAQAQADLNILESGNYNRVAILAGAVDVLRQARYLISLHDGMTVRCDGASPHEQPAYRQTLSAQ